ncbi:MAG: hypothetical protein ACOX9R_16030 [Armatimonadota bacterium]|jgi:hypothetical protein
MDRQPPDADRPPDEADEGDIEADEGIIGEIDPAETEAEPPSEEARRPRRQRSRMIGCLLALLGALAGGGLALWVARDAAIDRPSDQQTTAPLEALELPANRLVFSPTPERPDATPDIISAETEVIYVFYDMGRLPANATLAAAWTHEGESLGELPLAQHQPDEGAGHARGRFAIHPPPPASHGGAAADEGAPAGDGFPPGIYEVEITSPDAPDVAATGSFVALPRAAQILHGGGEPEGPPVIRSLQTATGVTEDGEPTGQSAAFPADIGRITAVFSYRGVGPGWVLTARWYAGDTEIMQARTEIAVSAAEGWAEAWLEVGEGATLPPGEYRVSVHLGDDDEALATTGFEIVPADDAPGDAAPD